VEHTKAARAGYDSVTAEMVAAGAETGMMMRMPCLKICGKLFAGLAADGMTFKLDGDAHASALALRGSRIFDPSGRRPMRQWVEVPAAHATRWPELAHAALEYVSRRETK
jgi:hypothetical protein